jgi:hypothetical protein
MLAAGEQYRRHAFKETLAPNGSLLKSFIGFQGTFPRCFLERYNAGSRHKPKTPSSSAWSRGERALGDVTYCSGHAQLVLVDLLVSFLAPPKY